MDKGSKKDIKDCELHDDHVNLLTDYFVFDGDDVELSFLKRTIENNEEKYKLCAKERKEIEGIFRDILGNYEKADFTSLEFPYLKNSLGTTLVSVRNKLKEPFFKGYFLLILFSNLSKIKKKLYDFYYQKIKGNNFGIPKALEGIINPELLKTGHYQAFLEHITTWYVKNEFIFFFLHFLNDFFAIKINFDENDYSVDKNYEFSLKIFVKKSFYKLSGFMLTKLSVFSKSFFMNKAASAVNYQHLGFLLLSCFSYGISLNKFIKTDFKPYAIMGAFVLHYLVGIVANALERQSEYVEIDNICEILKKLNKKVEKIRVCLFDLTKETIFELLEIDERNKKRIHSKIMSTTKILQKYLKNIDDLDNLTLDGDFAYTEEEIKNLCGNGDWTLLTTDKHKNKK